MNFARGQRGQLLVAGIVLIVVIALMISTLGFLYVSGQGASTLHGSSGTAYYAARSGIEVATRQFVNGTACAALTAGAQAVGTGGSFTLTGTSYNVSPPTANTTTVNATQAFIPIGAGVIGSYAPSGRVRIETEEIDYSAQSSDGTTCGGSPPCLVVAKRGAAGTTAAAHAAQPVYQSVCHIRSTGTSGRATRIAERSFHDTTATAAMMMVYAKVGSGVPAADYPRPFYRFWTGAAWGAEQTNASNFGLAGTANEIRWMALKMARTRNEAILATVHNDGSVRLQIWNGFQWFVPAALGAGGQLTAALGGDDAYRGVDIAYETANDRAIVVYNNGTRNPQYRIWDGSNLLAQVGVNTDLGGNYPTAGTPRWISLAANPLPASNEVVMMTLDSAADTSGIRWTGTAWATLEGVAPTVWFNDVSNGTTREGIAVAYEQNSGRAMFMWARDISDNISWRMWSGATPIGGVNNLNIPAMSGTGPGQWLRLVAQPNSNNLLFGVQDEGSDLNTRYWNGAAWDGAAQHPEPDGSVEQTTNRVYDLVFETHPTQINNAWIMWGDGGLVSARKFTLTSCAGSCWGATTTDGDDTSGVELLAHPQSGAVFALIYESSSAGTPEEILQRNLTGGAAAWTAIPPPAGTPASSVIWGGRNDSNTSTEGRQKLVARRAINIITQEYFP